MRKSALANIGELGKRLMTTPEGINIRDQATPTMWIPQYRDQRYNKLEWRFDTLRNCHDRAVSTAKAGTGRKEDFNEMCVSRLIGLLDHYGGLVLHAPQPEMRNGETCISLVLWLFEPSIQPHSSLTNAIYHFSLPYDTCCTIVSGRPLVIAGGEPLSLPSLPVSLWMIPAHLLTCRAIRHRSMSYYDARM